MNTTHRPMLFASILDRALPKVACAALLAASLSLLPALAFAEPSADAAAEGLSAPAFPALPARHDLRLGSTGGASESFRPGVIDADTLAFEADRSQEFSIETQGDGTERKAGCVLATIGAGATGAQVASDLASTGIVDMQATDLSDDALEHGIAEVHLVDGISIEEGIEAISALGSIDAAQENNIYYLDSAVADGDSAAAANGDAAAADGDSAVADGDSAAAANGDADADAAVTPLSTYPNDPSAMSGSEYYQWGIPAMDLYEAWDIARCSGSVTVAVLDTGARLAHEDLSANLDKAHAYDMANGRALTAGNTANGGDPVGHGTHVCGIISAVANNGKGVASVSYNAKVIPIKVFYLYGDGYVTDDATIIKAYDHLFDLIDNGAVTNLHVINMSLGGYGFDASSWALKTKIKQARDSYNIVTVAAAGNEASYYDQYNNTYFDGGNGYIYPSYPADYDECVCVCATKDSGSYSGVRDTYSNWNDFSDISAPGTAIYSTICDSNSSYGYMSGTSMAAPQVCGVVALMYAADPSATASQVISALYASADDCTSMTYAWAYSNDEHTTYQMSYVPIDPGWDMYTGWGNANAYRAANLMRRYPSQTSIASADIQGICDKWYTGSAITQDITVSICGKKLEQGTDYTVLYWDNTNAGTATMSVIGTGDYYGTATRTFAISSKVYSRLAGGDRYATMQKIVECGFGTLPGMPTVVITTGKDFPDALAASAYAGLYGSPVILTYSDCLSLEGAREVSKLGAKNAVIIGGMSAVSEDVVTELTTMGCSQVTRISGSDRYGTANAICEDGKSSWGDAVIIANGENFPDALSISPFAYSNHVPILLSNPTSGLGTEAIAAIKSCGFSKAVIVGGTSAVPAKVESQLKAAGIADSKRVEGSNRYITSRLIAEWSVSEGPSKYGNGTSLAYTTTLVATGRNFPDALAGGAFAGSRHGILVLADTSQWNGGAELASFVGSHASQIREWHVLGGFKVVPLSIYSYLEDAI